MQHLRAIAPVHLARSDAPTYPESIEPGRLYRPAPSMTRNAAKGYEGTKENEGLEDDGLAFVECFFCAVALDGDTRFMCDTCDRDMCVDCFTRGRAFDDRDASGDSCFTCCAQNGWPGFV